MIIFSHDLDLTTKKLYILNEAASGLEKMFSKQSKKTMAVWKIVKFTILFMIISAAVIMTYKYLNRSVANGKQVPGEIEYKNY